MQRVRQADFERQPRLQEQSPLGFMESVESVGSGLARGILDVDPDPSGSFLSRLAYKHREEPSQFAGQLLGYAVPYGLAAKGVGAIGKLPQLARAGAKVPGLVRGAIKSAGTGALASGVRETGRAISGTEADIGEVGKEAALFGAADIALRGAGKVVKPLMKRLRKPKTPEVKPLIEVAPKYTQVSKVSEGLRSEAEKRLIVNETAAPTPAGMKPYKILRVPGVTRGELEVMEKIPQQQPRQLVRKVKEGFENPIRMHERLGTKEIMYHPVREVENNAARRMKQAIHDFDKVKKTLPLGSRGKSSERIMTYAVAQQRGGMKVLGEMGVTEIPKLTPKESHMYQYMRGKLEGLYNELQQARMAAGLKPFPKVDNYFTFFRTIEGELQAGRDIIHIDPKKVLGSKLRTEKTPFRFAKSRILDDYGPLELDAIGVFERYTQSAVRHIEMTPQIAKMRQLLDGKFINKFSLEAENPDAYRQLNNWVNFVSGVDVHILPQAIERGLRKVNQNLGYAVLSYNLRSAAIQPTAALNTMTEIGPKFTLEGVKGLFNRQTRRFVMRNSNTLAGREHDIAITEMMQGLTGKTGAIKRKVGQVGIYPLQALDLETAKITWWGAYQKAQKVMGYTGKKAINYADDVVVRTQASAARSDLAPIQRAALGKSIATFQTFVINNWGFLTRDVVGIGNPKITNRVAMKKVLTYLVGATAINTLYEDALGVRSPFPAPINEYRRQLEKGNSQAKALYGAAREMMELVPLVGGGVRYGSHPAGAFLQTVGEAGKLATQPRITPKAGETVGKLLGVPGVTQAKKLHRQRQAEDKKKVKSTGQRKPRKRSRRRPGTRR
jgi:hypothetical protein